MLAIALCLSCLSAYVSPAQVWWLSFFGLVFAPLVVTNVVFAVLWLVLGKWKDLLLPVAVIALSLCFILAFIRCPFGKKEEVKSNFTQVKVLSYNVNFFGLKASYRDSSTYARMAAFVTHEKFDVACMQEFYMHNRVWSEQEFVQKMQHLPYRYIHYNVRNKNNRLGLATFSRYPIIGKGDIVFSNTTNGAIFVDIAFPFDTIRFYNVHLQSVRLGDRERDVLMDENFFLDPKKDKRKVLESVSWKLKAAFVRRAQQVDAVAEHMKRSPYAVVVCGDFNDTPVSYAYHTMRGNLRDGFMDAGRGMMSTYSSIIPSFRIDYILYDERFRANAYYCPDITYSDHYPLVTRLRLIGK